MPLLDDDADDADVDADDVDDDDADECEVDETPADADAPDVRLDCDGDIENNAHRKNVNKPTPNAPSHSAALIVALVSVRLSFNGLHSSPAFGSLSAMMNSLSPSYNTVVGGGLANTNGISAPKCPARR